MRWVQVRSVRPGSACRGTPQEPDARTRVGLHGGGEVPTAVHPLLPRGRYAGCDLRTSVARALHGISPRSRGSWPWQIGEVRKTLDDLCLELHYGRDLIRSDVLMRLQAVLASSAPKMFASLEVHAYERDRNRLVVNPEQATSLRQAVLARGTCRGPTFDALVADAPPPADGRRFGSVLLRGRGAGTGGRFMSVNFDTRVPAMPVGTNWLWSNSIGMTVSTARIEGSQRSAWVEQFAADLSKHPDFLWGAAYLQGEFHASNLDTSEGMRAIGRDVREHLPGVFWLNLFGQPYRDLIGVQALRTAPAAVLDEDEHRIVLRTFESPEDWPDGIHAKGQLRRHLGDDIFFDRTHPARPTRAPDFGLGPLRELPSFEVFTSDGEHFTPLPRLDG